MATRFLNSVNSKSERAAGYEPQKSALKNKGLSFQERKRGGRKANTKYSARSESHVPRFQERVGTSHPGYMIPNRLPWRLRARPSATLHEIQVRFRTEVKERTCPDHGTRCWIGTSRANWMWAVRFREPLKT